MDTQELEAPARAVAQAHGVIPVPVPATLNICRACGLPLGSREVEGELFTPTGAAHHDAPSSPAHATSRCMR